MTEKEGDTDKSEKPEVVLREERVLDFWKENDIFKKSVEKDAPKGDFVFYDGPPFATGLLHYGHLVPGTIKDVIPRYKTMNGYRVVRRWGWDTQGVPIEAIVQKENNLDTKKDIEKFGIKNFTDSARKTIFRYADDWREIIPRTGRWADFDDLYITMSPDYTESIWWMWNTLYGKGMVYEGFKSMHISPPLETALSNFEVNQGYKDITDLSATAKFELEGEENTFLLAWTTTPWTLPANVALAINKKITYIKVEFEGANYIVAKDLVENVFGERDFNLVSEIENTNLIGRSYKPVFQYYYNDNGLENKGNGWKIYDADFVTTEDGTGIVHIAPAFGEDDLNLGKEFNLPFIQHVRIDGTIKDEVKDFAGLQAKPKDDPMSTDIEVVKYLAHGGLLFDKKKYTHSYPHCYRTGAPLLNYAMSSWFIKVTEIKDKLVAENNKINWTPEFVGNSRFGNWLKEAKDWGVSRSRYWGTPIPVWKSEDGREVAVVGSLEDLRNKTKKPGKKFIIRHGEAEHNVGNFVSDDNSVPSKLTENGKKQVEQQAKKLSKEKVDIIISSPLMRTKETSEMMAEHLGVDKEKIIYDERIREVQTGVNGQPIEEYRSYFDSVREKFDKAHPAGETLTEMKKRIGEFLYEIEEKYGDKNVLIVTHEYVAWMMVCVRNGYNKDQCAEIKELRDDFVKTGEFIKLDFSVIPHDEEYELDFHRPYIDEITFTQKGKKMTRIQDVFDTWIDSGSVPYASHHYPFEKDRFDPKPGFLKHSKGYPADFIAEGLDQTRGWFYSMIVLNTALFGKAPYKNVVVNGLLLAEDGRKMSKSLKNYPPMDDVLKKYGADALRYFLMASPLVRAEESPFSEKGVDEVMKKLIGRLDNVVSFYEMYSDSNTKESGTSTNTLDRWIISRLNSVTAEVTESLENYEIDRAARPLMGFINDLSTWYVRRSRDRFKKENDEFFDKAKERQGALATTKYVLVNFSKLLAPFTPFIAEDVYQRVVRDKTQSVHLADWPKVSNVDKKILEEMTEIRGVVTKALEIRTNAGIKVRQPLASLTLKDQSLKGEAELLEILKEEINVKEIRFNSKQEEEFILDQKITDELKLEGYAREIIRAIQSLRKKNNLSPNDEIVLSASNSIDYIIKKFEEEIVNTTKVKEIKFGITEGEVVKIGDGEENYISIE